MSNITQNWVEVLNVFKRNSYEKLSVSDVVKSKKMPQQSVSRIMNNLVKENILDYEEKGKMKLYFVKDKYLKEVQGVVEYSDALDFKVRNKIEGLIVSSILSYCEGVIVFGSYAENKQKKGSDLDLIVIGKCDKQKINSVKRKGVLEVNIDFFSWKEFNDLIKKKTALGLEIRKKHIFFGNVSKMLEVVYG